MRWGQSHVATESLPGSHNWELGCTPEIRLRLDTHTRVHTHACTHTHRLWLWAPRSEGAVQIIADPL